MINDAGGVIGRVINKKVTIVVCSNPTDHPEDIKKAEQLKIPVVRETFIVDSVAKITRLKPEDYLPVSTSTTSTNASKDDDGDTNGSAAKKQKLDPVVVDNSIISSNSEWMGVCIAKDSSTYPFVLHITTRTDNNIEGTINWPTLGDTLTKIRGSITNDDLKFEEYEATRGEDNVELPQNYSGKFTGSAVSGSLTDTQGESSSFKLNLVSKRSAKAQDLPFLQAKAQFEGTYQENYPMEMTVISRTSMGDLAGTVYWSSLDPKTKTKFKGELATDGKVKLEEFQLLEGDGVEIPNEYEGKLNGNSIKGTYNTPVTKANGEFTLEMQKSAAT